MLLDWSSDVCSDRKSTRLNSSHANISYAVFCLKKEKAASRAGHVSGLAVRPSTTLATVQEALAALPTRCRAYEVLTAVKHFPALFFFNDTATTEIYTLSLHDALPI